MSLQMVYDLIPPQELNAFLRGILDPDLALAGLAPERNIEDIEYRFTRGDFADEDVATYRAWDTEAPPAARRTSAVRVSGELPPVSRMIAVGEEQRIRLRALYGGGGQRPDGQRVPNALIEAMFDDAAKMRRAVRARLELARGAMFSTGKVVINENGVVAKVDFGVPAGNKVTATAPWTDPTAPVVTDLLGWLDDYRRATGGGRPAFIQTSQRAIDALLGNDQLRTYALSRALSGNVPAGTPPILRPDERDGVLNAFQIPPLRPYDTELSVDGVMTRVIPDTLALLMPNPTPDFAETLYGITAEAMEQAGAGEIAFEEAPGIVGVTYRSVNPIRIFTEATAIGLPVLKTPQALMIATVL